jgi:hypothetical protein
MIILEPFGGLANRMRVIASGIALKQRTGKDLTIIWNENYELNCPYHLLFKDEAIFKLITKKRWHRYITSSNQPTVAGRLRSRLLNRLMGIHYSLNENDICNLAGHGKLDTDVIANANKTIYINTCQEFYRDDSAFKKFTPIAAVTEKIEAITARFAARTIGVHIRRTDNGPSITHSPIELFTMQMNRERAEYPETKFFLSTDDKAVQYAMEQEFGDLIISHPKAVIDRQSVIGIQDAVTDLYCLAATNKILGSYYSSFSEVAAKITQIPLQVLSTRPAFDPENN